MGGQKIILFGLFLVLTGAAVSSEDFLEISGIVCYKEEGEIYIYLVDEETSSIPFSGLEVHKITPEEFPGSVSFSFSGLTGGKYGIRCFQDRNGNGTLDKGLFGPTEPWGLSWQGIKPKKWPQWRNFSFDLYSDREDLKIELQ